MRFGTQFIILILRKAKAPPHKKQGREAHSQEASASVLEDKPGNPWECRELKSICITLPVMLCYIFLKQPLLPSLVAEIAAQSCLLLGCCLKVPLWCFEAPLRGQIGLKWSRRGVINSNYAC